MSEYDDGAIISLDKWRTKTFRAQCQHRRVILDDRAGVVECRDCGVTLSAFHVLKRYAEGERDLFKRLETLRAEAEELKRWRPFLRTMKALEKLWRGKQMLPCCPHCSRGLWPEELEGAGSVGVRHEIEVRRKLNIRVPDGADKNGGLSVIDGTLGAQGDRKKGGA